MTYSHALDRDEGFTGAFNRAPWERRFAWRPVQLTEYPQQKVWLRWIEVKNYGAFGIPQFAARLAATESELRGEMVHCMIREKVIRERLASGIETEGGRPTMSREGKEDTVEELTLHVAKALSEQLKRDCVNPRGECYAHADEQLMPDGMVAEVDGEFDLLGLAEAAIKAMPGITVTEEMIKALEAAFDFLGGVDGAVEIRERLLAALSKVSPLG